MENAIEIIDYDEKYHSEFKTLNLEWLDKYNLTESHDHFKQCHRIDVTIIKTIEQGDQFDQF